MRDVCSGVLDLLFPVHPIEGPRLHLGDTFCRRCGEPFDAESGPGFTCTNCRGRRWALVEARAAYRAEGAVLDTVHALKYRREFHRIPELGTMLVEGYDRFFAVQAWDVIVPVPLHRKRRRERGFNQAEELARWLSRRRKLPLWNGLRRIKATEVQARLRRSQRLRNQAGAYALRNEQSDLTGKQCLIIDDVFTTGATVNACARILKKAGAESVSALTVARG